MLAVGSLGSLGDFFTSSGINLTISACFACSLIFKGGDLDGTEVFLGVICSLISHSNTQQSSDCELVHRKDINYLIHSQIQFKQNILDASYFRTCSTREVPAGNFTGIQYSWGETTGAWEKHFLVEYIGPVYQYFGTDYWPAETYDLTDYSLVAPVSVAETPSPSTALVLDTPFPNPFNAVTALPFTLAADGHVRAAVYNLAGQRVRTLLSGTVLPAGNHTLSWDGCDDAGLTAASGVYLVQVIQGDHHRTARVCFVK